MDFCVSLNSFQRNFGIWILCLTFCIIAPAVSGDDQSGEVALPADNEWQYLSFERRHSQMTFLVHPTMMEKFQAFYKTPTPELTCASCHGENAESEGYNRANSDIKPLKPSRVRALYEAGATLTPLQRFKRDDITPTMARLMGVPQYDPTTGLGFSCFGCHRRTDEQ